MSASTTNLSEAMGFTLTSGLVLRPSFVFAMLGLMLAETITILATGEKESFEINGYKKHNMINGYDDIDYLQSMKDDIRAFVSASQY